MSSKKFNTTFENIEEAYRQLAPALSVYASQYLLDKNYSYDCVNDAFLKLVAYFAKHPEKKIVVKYIYYQVHIATKKYNRMTNTVFYGPREFDIEHGEQ